MRVGEFSCVCAGSTLSHQVKIGRHTVVGAGSLVLKDLPDAEMHRLKAGHFAVEDHLDYISDNMHRFYAEKVASSKR